MKKAKVILCVLLALLTGLANLGTIYASNIDSSVIAEPYATPTPAPKPAGLTVKIGKVSGPIGDTVTVPVYFNNLNSKLNNCDFVLSYDNNAVELTSVKAGEIVTNPSVNFYSNIISGKVAILFADETQGYQPISKDGVFANLIFKIKSGFSDVQLKELGSFNDPDLRDIAVKFISDTIITPTPVPTPTPSPTPSVITLNPLLGKNIKIQLTSNNYDYVYYYFNKTADIPQGDEIQLTTRANFENGEIFSIEEDIGNGKVFLKAISPEGKVDGYLSVNEENRVVISKTLMPSNTESFELNYQMGSGYFTLKSLYNGKFVCADVFSGYSVTADRDEASVWETFKANILADTKPTPTPTPKPMAEIYADGDYQGLSQTLSIGSYNLNDLKIGNDVLSSLKVPQGLKVTLYEHVNFQGRTKTFTENASWVGDDFNDITSSIVVEPAPPSTPIPTDFTVEIGKVSGCIGDTVTVPVTFKNLKENIDDCDFTLSYDRNSVELKSIEAGSIVGDPSVNFNSQDNSGNAVFLFSDETVGKYPISKDGVFANLVFKIKAGASKIWISRPGAFINKNFEEMAVNFTDGAINCATPTPPPPTPTPSITPTPTVSTALSPSIINVDASSLKDIDINVGTLKIYNITNGTTALAANDWSRSGNTITISKWYLKYYFNKFPDQNLYLNFNFTTGTSAVLTVYTGSSPYVSMADSISYYVNSGDAKISLIPNGHFITSVKNGDKTLAPRIDYTYDPSKQIFYIRKGYLNNIFSQTSQPLKLTVNFTGNDIKTVTIYPIPENPQEKAVAQLSISDKLTQ